MRKIIMWVLVLVLLLPSIVAVKTTQVSTTDAAEIVIIYPKNDYFVYEQDFTLHFHAYNSTGYLLTNDTTVCNLHVYNETGNHVYETDMLFDGNGVDFYYIMSGSKFTHTGEYGYLIHCNSDTESGFISSNFLIANGSPMGESVTGWLLAALIIAPLLFSLILIGGIALLDPVEHIVLRIITFLFSYIAFFMSLLLGAVSVARYLDFQAMQDNITILLWVTGLMLFVIISYFMIYIFYKSIQAAGQKKDEMMLK